MKVTSILAGALYAATTTFAYSVDINATTSGIDKPDGGFKIITANLYEVNNYDSLAVTALQLIDSSQLPPSDVECRMYKDANALNPGSAPFSGHNKALISTNTVSVGSIACYVISKVPGS